LESVPVVLVVEDEEPLQEIVHDALKAGGFDLTAVASGREAVAMIESGVVKYFGAGKPTSTSRDR
jgi:CheY-like chemotaxis protein